MWQAERERGEWQSGRQSYLFIDSHTHTRVFLCVCVWRALHTNGQQLLQTGARILPQIERERDRRRVGVGESERVFVGVRERYRQSALSL